MDSKQIDVMVADASHEVYVDKILDTIREAAKVRGTGIAERTHEYVATKMKEGKAIIALCGDEFAGFTYIESWGNKQYVATSGLIVHPDYRGLGLAKRIKTENRRRFPRIRCAERRKDKLHPYQKPCRRTVYPTHRYGKSGMEKLFHFHV